MTKPRIYGDEGQFRRALTRSIRNGQTLLDQTEGVRRRMKLVEESRLDTLVIEQDWEQGFRRWFNATGRALAPFLQEQLAVPWGGRGEDDGVLPTLSAGLPPDSGKPRHRIGIDNGEEWLRKTLDELRELQTEIAPASTPSAPSRASVAQAPVARSRWDSIATNRWVVVISLAGAVASIVALLLVFVH
jgi:hypothetical protein